MLNLLAKYKANKYGEIAIKFRRGLLSLDEAQFYWDQIERDYLAMVTACENSEVAIAIETGLTALLS